MRFLILGDVIGTPGVRAVTSALKGLMRTHRADFVVVNGENSVDGYGVNRTTAGQLFSSGADVITTGNHVWRDEHVGELLTEEPRVLRPDNYPSGAPGSGVYIEERKSHRIAVINLQGRERMPRTECPFRRFRDIMKRLGSTVDYVIVDFHAESTAEKEAFAHYADGDATVVFGTHTHVQTADERILPRGTAAITDVGACLPVPSVIGFNPEISQRRVLTQLPLRNEVAQGAATIHGLVVETAKERQKATSVERFQFRSLV